MKNILVGICDIGMGHLNRQICILNELQKYDVNLILTCTKNNKEILDQKFPNIKKVCVDIPWIACDKNGIDFKETMRKYIEKGVDHYYSFLSFCEEVNEYFDCKCDYVFTDYEPNVAQYAYANDIKLIGMEQHSKFLFLDTKEVDNYSINEEISRLKYFFPRVDYRVISTFFPIKKIKNSLILPPIIDYDRKYIPSKEKFILVYFSPYVKDSNFFNNILKIIKEDKKNYYKVYTKFNFENCENIKFIKFNDNFKNDLFNCKFLLSTAGHQLISEAIYLEKPLYLFPIDTFEQHYTNYICKKYNLGSDIGNDYQIFLKKIPFYKRNIKKYKEKYVVPLWKEKLAIFFEKQLFLERCNKMKKPNRLKEKDVITLTALSSGADEEKETMQKAITNLSKYYIVKYTDNVFGPSKVSSSVEERIKELNDSIIDKTNKMILVSRGGDFFNELIDKIDYESIKNRELLVEGSSDCTPLLYILTTKYSLMTVYGKNGKNFSNMNKALENNIKILNGEKIIQKSFGDRETKANNEFETSGIIIGGCLDSLKNIIGTKYDNTENFIKQYDNVIWYFDTFSLNSLDFYLTLLQFKQAGWFKKSNTFIFGTIKYPNVMQSITYEEALEKIFGDLNYVYNSNIGHVSPSFTIINGMETKVCYKNNILYIEQDKI